LPHAVGQGLSPDPDLFLNRVQLLAAYSMIEHLFITTDGDGRVGYTPLGRRHVQLLHEYETRIGRAATALLDDCPHFRPVDGAYSPYGVLYGFSSNLMEHMALKTSQPGAVTRFGVEDVFTGGDASTGKLAWVNGWRKLPHLTRDVEKLFDYPQQLAEDVFNRIEHAVGRTAVSAGRLFVQTADVPDLPARYLRSSDEQFLKDRREGTFLVSYETADGWRAITKTMLTEVLATGQDVKAAGLPPAAIEALTLMCARFINPPP